MTKEELIEKIVDITMPYCNNCRYDTNDDEHCDYCHRKSIGWEMSDETADKIIELVKKELI